MAAANLLTSSLLAFAWSWHASRNGVALGLAQRLAASLCSGIGGAAGHAEIDGLHFAYRPLTGNASQVRTWRPARLDSGAIVAFHGFIDNPAELSVDLGASPGDLASLYGRAVERWGSNADHHVIGEYCAIVAYPERNCVTPNAASADLYLLLACSICSAVNFGWPSLGS